MNSLHPRLAFGIVVLASSFFLAYLVWLLIPKVAGLTILSPITIRRVRIFLAIFVVLIVNLASPLFIGYLLPEQGMMQMPLFRADSDIISVVFGRGPNGKTFQIPLGTLRHSKTPYPILTVNNNTVFSLEIRNDGILCVNANVFVGLGKKPVVITDNTPDDMPRSWAIERSNKAFEMLNEKNIPVLVMEYQSPYTIIVEGIFDAGAAGPLLIDDIVGWKVLSEQGFPPIYTVKRVFVRTWLDVFLSSRQFSMKTELL
jgi:hypothetical protein